MRKVEKQGPERFPGRQGREPSLGDSSLEHHFRQAACGVLGLGPGRLPSDCISEVQFPRLLNGDKPPPQGTAGQS